jgi:hypothetical protein
LLGCLLRRGCLGRSRLRVGLRRLRRLGLSGRLLLLLLDDVGVRLGRLRRLRLNSRGLMLLRCGRLLLLSG